MDRRELINLGMEERDTALDIMLQFLPQPDDLIRDLSLTEAESVGANPCGETKAGRPVYKLLTSSGEMLTYIKDGDVLVFLGAQKLHT